MAGIQDLIFKEGDDPAKRILPPDLQVAVLAAQGYERNDIARVLNTSRSAVNRHMAKLFSLTGTVNAASLVAALLAWRVIGPQDVDSLAPLGAEDVKASAANRVREGILRKPYDDVERHMNHVLEGIANDIERHL